MCGGKGMMMDPDAHPYHMNIIHHLPYGWSGCGNHSMWVWGLNQGRMASFGTQCSDPGFQPTSQIRAVMCGGNGMMTDPYALPLHMSVVITLHMFVADTRTIPCGFGA